MRSIATAIAVVLVASTAPNARAIVGGTEAAPGAWPWTAALLSGPDPFLDQYCGGSLITSTWVLTTVDCLTDNTGRPITDVLLGVHDLVDDSGERLDVVQTVIHPDFDAVSLDNDIVLLELASSSGQTPIARADENVTAAIPEGGDVTAIGWGATDVAGQSFPTALRQVALPFISSSACIGLVGPLPDGVSENMICTGTRSGGNPVDTCFGDGGGPLMVFDGGQWQLVGITSFGFTVECAPLGFPAVYTRVANYESWIVSVVPEPSALALQASALAAIACIARRARRR